MRLLPFFLALILSSCRGVTALNSSQYQLLNECNALANEFRSAVDSAGVNNAGIPAIAAAPFLHGSRFYDRLILDVENDLQARELLSQLIRLGDDIRRSENENLRSPWDDIRLDAISRCGSSIATDSRQQALREELIGALQSRPAVKDHYRSAAQWIGLHPLLRPVFKWRIGLLHQQEKRWFAAPENFTNPITYELEVDVAPIEAKPALQRAYAASPLGLPAVSDETLSALFKQYAPALTIESLGPQDRPGIPVATTGNIVMDHDEIVAYTLASFTRFSEQNLLQLNYVFWFPSRRARSWIDLYAGTFDSLVWRVTLDENGEVLLYDSIHSCGCYHKFFVASNHIAIRTEPTSGEPANIFDLSALDHGARLHLTITDNEHYIVGVDNQPVLNAIPYRLAPYRKLYNLETASGTRSLFDADGFVADSERLERLTLWPTGIENVGAMRQWGTHATGFVARQHFDDAELFDNYFFVSD